MWALVAQYFVMLVVVQAAWSSPYSIVQHAISDLGAVTCGSFEGREVCSPWHVAANASWAVTGLCIALGAVLLWRLFAHDVRSRIGMALLVVAGLSEVLVGLNPEDTSALHVPAAIVTIVSGLVGILLVGSSLMSRPAWRRIGIAGVALGIIGLTATVVLILTGLSPWFGLIERIAAYPILLWVTFTGVAVVRRARAGRVARYRS
ncbi:DUF998 domain-containing protein [Streptomyces sp. NRRL F-5630]|uniref:DUF998 domain-containing protein n=1 Tax=Streptomyces sp. NRRL F-5630 TaxID=1463864 RepID=UPI003EB79927